ncbi:MAG: FAD-dependent oxidoreductase [Ignavibacteriota bacterium]
MAEFKRPTNEQEFENNFSPIKVLMNKSEAILESSKCLFCYDAPCTKACPTHIDIPLFIRQINSGNMTGSAMTIYASNYMGNLCGKVCPVEVLCEGSCVYVNQGVKAVEIGRLQNYATHKVLSEKIHIFSEGEKVNKKVAIIGGGPAGLSCASELRKAGIEVDIYEGRKMAAGLALHGIAPYKIANEDVLEELNYLQEQFHFNIIYNSFIKTKADVAKLEKEYDAVFLGIGNSSTSALNIPGEDKKEVYGAVEIIEELRMKKSNLVYGNKVIVFGGGNTAMDAASESARMGAETVLLAYRRSKENMGAYEFEYDLAKSAGVKAYFNVAPVEILGDEKVTGVKFIKTEIKDGKLKTIAGSEFNEKCDMVIKATGQSRHFELFDNISKLEIDDFGRIVVDENFRTTNPKYYAGGDAVNGGKEVVNSVAEGKVAATSIIKQLTKI